MKRKKMKVNILSLLGLAAMLFTACATDDVAPDRQNQKQKSDGEGLTAFSVNNETPPRIPRRALPANIPARASNSIGLNTTNSEWK